MTVARRPDRRALVRVGVGVVGIGAVLVGLWLAADFASANLRASDSAQQATATVVTSAPCAGAHPQDTVTFSLAGRTHKTTLDSCGDQVGETMSVLVPSGFTDGTTVEPAMAAPGDSAGLFRRVSFVMMALVALLSGGLVYLFLRRAGKIVPYLNGAAASATASKSGRRAATPPTTPPAAPEPADARNVDTGFYDPRAQDTGFAEPPQESTGYFDPRTDDSGFFEPPDGNPTAGANGNPLSGYFRQSTDANGNPVSGYFESAPGANGNPVSGYFPAQSRRPEIDREIDPVTDSGPHTEKVDPAQVETGHLDPRSLDTAFHEAPLADTGYFDPRSEDTGFQDPKLADTGYQDPRLADTGYYDPRTQDTEFVDAATADTGFVDPRAFAPRELDEPEEIGLDDIKPAKRQKKPKRRKPGKRGRKDGDIGDSMELPRVDPAEESDVNRLTELTRSTEVNWFTDSGTALPINLNERADRS